MRTNKMKKSIYLLIVVAVLCFSLAMFPLMNKTSYAEEVDIETYADSLTITSIMAEQKADEDGKWTINFALSMQEQSFVALTEGGEKAVYLGALIGPAKRLDNVTDFESAKKQGFVALAPVGSADSGAQTEVEFNGGKFDFSVGIRYDIAKIASAKRILASSTELVAIPFVARSGEACAVLENKKQVAPRLTLADKYTSEKELAEKTISQTVADNFAGTFTTLEGDYYICRDTSRLMSSPYERGDLKANDILNNDYELFVLNGEVMDIGKKTANLDSAVVNALPKNSVSTISIFKQDGTIASTTAPVAERVIIRFFKQDTHSELNDWLADSPTTSGVKKKGVFYIGSQGPNGPINTIDGLYVLGNDITPNVLSRTFDVSDNYSAAKELENNQGFIGTFDGRGKIIDYDYSFTGCRSYRGGVFGIINGGTVKNVAILNVHPAGEAGGAFCYMAKNARLENIYITVDSVTEFVRVHNLPIVIATAEDTHFENFLIESNITDFEYFPEDVGGDRGQPDNGCGYSSSMLVGWNPRNTASQSTYDIFSGNTANNLIAVGNSPLYQILYDGKVSDAVEDPFKKQTGTSPTGEPIYTTRYYYDPDKHFVATRIANGPMQYSDKGVLKDCISYEYSGGTMKRVFYPISAFADTDQYERILEMAEHATYAMKCRMSKEFIYEVEQYHELKLGFMWKDGFYDMLNWDEATSFYVENQEKLQNFITNGGGCWYINEGTGQVVWDTLNFM